MAKKTSQKETSGVLIQNIEIRQVNRTNHDISTWRAAIQSAENVQSPKRIQLYDLYSDILLDAHITSVTDKRKMSVSNRKIRFVKDGKEDEIISELCEAPWFLDFLQDIVDTRFWGYSVFEFEFSKVNDAQQVKYWLIPRKHIVPEKGLLVRGQSDTSGIDINDPQYDNYTIKVGKKDDLGLIMKAAQYVIYKRGGFGDWSQFAEVFGMPFRKATYNGYDENTRLLLIEAMKEAGSAAYAVLPEGSNLEFLESKSTGSNTLYKELINACNSELSKLILGQTLTTEQGDKGARSLGDVHMQTEDMIHSADMQYVKNVLNFSFRNLLLKNGYAVEKGEFQFVDDTSIDLKDKITIDQAVYNMGVPIDDDYFYETYGIPKPDNYDQMVAEKKANKPPVAGKGQPPDGLTADKKNLKAFIQHLGSFFGKVPESQN